MVTKRLSRHEKAAFEIIPKTAKQVEYLEALDNFSQVVVLGPAGTGKTFIAATHAAGLLVSKQVSKIVLTRPNISSGRSLGYFPGSLEEKMAPWMMPVLDVLYKHLTKVQVTNLIKTGVIEIAPFETMRGRSFEDCYIILDEAQNVSPHEMKMFLTRVGENCTVVLNGDVEQSDLSRDSGLVTAIKLIKRYLLPIPIIEFKVEDIVRSDLCKAWIIAFMKEEGKY